jgi:hypothetical protein
VRLSCRFPRPRYLSSCLADVSAWLPSHRSSTTRAASSSTHCSVACRSLLCALYNGRVSRATPLHPLSVPPHCILSACHPTQRATLLFAASRLTVQQTLVVDTVADIVQSFSQRLRVVGSVPSPLPPQRPCFLLPSCLPTHQRPFPSSARWLSRPARTLLPSRPPAAAPRPAAASRAAR